MMKQISIEAKLSIIYTNHCIRATSISILYSCGFEARHIMSISGHRSESSIRSYSRTDLQTKQKMSDNLSSFISSKQFKPNFSFGINFPEHEMREEREPISDVSNNGTKDVVRSLVENCDGQFQISNCIFNF